MATHCGLLRGRGGHFCGELCEPLLLYVNSVARAADRSAGSLDCPVRRGLESLPSASALGLGRGPFRANLSGAHGPPNNRLRAGHLPLLTIRWRTS